MQGAGGGGAGSSSYYGGGAGGICVCILNIRQLKETGGCFKIGLAPGAIKQSQGGNSYLKYNTSRTASSGDVTICTAGGGNPGETSSGGGGGTYS